MRVTNVLYGSILGLLCAVPAMAQPSTAQPKAAAAPSAPPAPAPATGYYVTRSGTAMGTFVQIRIYIDKPPSSHTPEIESTVGGHIEKAFAEIRRLEALMTTWSETSEVARINKSAANNLAPEAVPVGKEVFDCIERSLVYSKLSRGAFDISFYGLKGLWHFDDDLKPELPDPALIKQRLPLIDWRQIIVDRQRSTVRLGKPGMAINLGGIGKGYAVDSAVRLLKAAGLQDGVVQAGGDLMLFGSKGGKPFIAGVRDPRSPRPDDYFAVCPVRDRAFSTAGDYERSFVRDGKRYHHILDPRTGYPSTGARSVTIYAKDATTADGLDDAVLILGPQKGLQLVESLPDVGAIIVDGQNRVHISRRLKGLVEIVHPPTPGI